MIVFDCGFQQTTEQSYPQTLLIAINKYGVNLIDPQTKARLAEMFS